MLDPKGPGLRVRRGPHGANRPDGPEADIVHETKGTACRLYQSVWIRVAQVQVRCRAIVLIVGNHAGILVESLGAVTAHAVRARPRLRVIDAIAATRHPLVSELIGKAEAWLDPAPICIGDCTLVRTRKNLSTVEGPQCR